MNLRPSAGGLALGTSQIARTAAPIAAAARAAKPQFGDAAIAETDSNHSSSLAEADALIVQPENDPGTEAGEIVEIIPLNMLS